MSETQKKKVTKIVGFSGPTKGIYYKQANLKTVSSGLSALLQYFFYNKTVV